MIASTKLKHIYHAGCINVHGVRYIIIHVEGVLR